MPSRQVFSFLYLLTIIFPICLTPCYSSIPGKLKTEGTKLTQKKNAENQSSSIQALLFRITYSILFLPKLILKQTKNNACVPRMEGAEGKRELVGVYRGARARGESNRLEPGRGSRCGYASMSHFNFTRRNTAPNLKLLYLRPLLQRAWN